MHLGTHFFIGFLPQFSVRVLTPCPGAQVGQGVNPNLNAVLLNWINEILGTLNFIWSAS